LGRLYFPFVLLYGGEKKLKPFGEIMGSCACGQMYCNGCMKEQPIADKDSAIVPAKQESPGSKPEETGESKV
jgi:hypothetical protein